MVFCFLRVIMEEGINKMIKACGKRKANYSRERERLIRKRPQMEDNDAALYEIFNTGNRVL